MGFCFLFFVFSVFWFGLVWFLFLFLFCTFSLSASESHTGAVEYNCNGYLNVCMVFGVPWCFFFFPLYLTKVSKICDYERNPYLYKIQCSLTELVLASCVNRMKRRRQRKGDRDLVLLIQLAQFAFPV